MKLNGRGTVRAFGVLVAGLALAITQRATFADKKPKSYPETGKVIGTGTTEHERKGFSHTYKIETDKAILLVDCGKLPFFGGTGEECGGQKKIQIGDVLHFRVENSNIYIPVADPTGAEGSDEQKMRIMSQELKPDAPAEKPPASQP